MHYIPVPLWLFIPELFFAILGLLVFIGFCVLLVNAYIHYKKSKKHKDNEEHHDNFYGD